MAYIHAKKVRKDGENYYRYLYLREKVYKRDKRTLKKSGFRKGYSGKATESRWKYTKTKDIKYLGRIIYPKSIKEIDFESYLESFKLTFSKILHLYSYEKIIGLYVDYLYFIIDGVKEEKMYYAINDGFLGSWTLKPLLEFKFNIDERVSPKSESNRFSKIFRRCGFLWEEVDLRTALLKMKVDEAINKKGLFEISENIPEVSSGVVPKQDLDDFYKSWYGKRYEKEIKRIVDLKKSNQNPKKRY